MSLYATIAYVIWCAVWWRFRGGAFTTLTGINPGTDGMRAIASLAVSAPLWAFTPWFIPLIFALSLLIGLKLTGWEEFQDMAINPSSSVETEKPGYWMRWLPDLLGFKPGSLPHDIVGMAEAGFITMLTPAAGMVYWYHPGALWLLAAGAAFPIGYLLSRYIPLPTIPAFAQGQSWGEIFVGAIIACGVSATLL